MMGENLKSGRMLQNAAESIKEVILSTSTEQSMYDFSSSNRFP